MTFARSLTFLRSLLFMVFLVITVVPYAVCCILWAPLPLAWRYRLTLGWPRLALWAATWILGIRYRTQGMERLPDGPVIILSKHQSAWETLYFAVSMPRDVVFVYKRELHHVPFFGWSLALLSMIPIDRTKGRESFEQVVRIGGQRLREGRWPVLFPEGTRVAPGKEGRYKQGGALLACRTGTPVIPVAHNAGERWPCACRGRLDKSLPCIIYKSRGSRQPSDKAPKAAGPRGARRAGGFETAYSALMLADLASCA